MLIVLRILSLCPTVVVVKRDKIIWEYSAHEEEREEPWLKKPVW